MIAKVLARREGNSDPLSCAGGDALQSIPQRPLTLAIVLPGPRPREQVRDAAQRVAHRVEAFPDLLPREWHGDRSTGPGPWRERRYRRCHPVVAQIVEEDAPG